MNAPEPFQKLDNFIVVLVQPLGGGNVGSIARTMASFGLSRLRLVSPRCDVKSIEARSMAMSAQPLLSSAGHYATLREAIQDCGWAIATSRRLGRNRKTTLYPREGAPYLLRRAKNTSVALVFGREDKGLRTDEVDLCQERLLIPAMPQANSFNLSQAALLVLWEIYMANLSHGAVWEPTSDPVPMKKAFPAENIAIRKNIEGLVDHLVATLETIGFVPHNHPERVARSFRSLIDRIQPSEREVRMMRGVLRQLTWKVLNNGSVSPWEHSELNRMGENSPSLATTRKNRLNRNL